MKSMSKMKRTIRNAGLLGIAGLVGLAISPRDARAEWTAPEEERQVPNPVKRTAESIEAGRALYVENCETCHGADGKGDGPAARVLEARLPDLSDESWASPRTDGEFFYKISVGKDPMIGYEGFLEDEEIWHVVNYVRALSVGPATDEAEAVAEPAAPEQAAAEEAAGSAADNPGHAEKEESGAGEAASEATEDAAHEAHGGEADDHGEAGHEDDDHAAAAAGHGDDHHSDGHGTPAHAASADFDPRGLANYESTYAKGPLVWTLIVSVLMGAVFVLGQKMLPPLPEPEPAGDGHDDHGH